MTEHKGHAGSAEPLEEDGSPHGKATGTCVSSLHEGIMVVEPARDPYNVADDHSISREEIYKELEWVHKGSPNACTLLESYK